VLGDALGPRPDERHDRRPREPVAARDLGDRQLTGIDDDGAHTAASNLIASGADMVTVAMNTGHSVQVLMSTYAHEVEEALRRAAERMDDIITGTRSRAGK
jgi:integrase